MRGPHHGFTMVEIMVVIVIVGLMAGIVTMSWQSTLPAAQLNSTVRVLSERIHGARADAIARNLEFRLYYDLDNDDYWIETPFAAEGGRLAHGEEQRLLLFETQLDPTVSFHEITIDGEIYTDGIVYVRFDPLGASSDHRIVLYQTIFDRYFSIEVLALTGLVRFHDGLYEPEPPRDGDFD